MNKINIVILFSLLLAVQNFATNKRNDLIKVPLPYSKTEVEEIQKIIGGDLLINKDATLENFLKKAENYDIIHIATHTIVNENLPLSSEFLFNPSSENYELFLSDIYALNLKAKLATLSACNTGRGKLEKGEGIMSFAHAFKFAGCSSIVMSLWAIDDISTAKIMKNFYAELKKGLPKDVALRNAKLKYIEAGNSKTAAPVFWAGAVPIGEMQPLKIEIRQNASFFTIVITGLLLLLLLVVSVYRNKLFGKRRNA